MCTCLISEFLSSGSKPAYSSSTPGWSKHMKRYSRLERGTSDHLLAVLLPILALACGFTQAISRVLQGQNVQMLCCVFKRTTNSMLE